MVNKEDDMKFCKYCNNCKHMIWNSEAPNGGNRHCLAPEAIDYRNFDIGNPLCEDMRHNEDCCSSTADWFKPKVSNG